MNNCNWWQPTLTDSREILGVGESANEGVVEFNVKDSLYMFSGDEVI
jgi:hypothetical protein